MSSNEEGRPGRMCAQRYLGSNTGPWEEGQQADSSVSVAAGADKDRVLTETEIDEALEQIPGWTLVLGGRFLERVYIFLDHLELVRFLVQVSKASTTVGHYAHISAHDKHLTLRLSTSHDAGDALTSKDFELAGCINGLVPPKPPSA